MDQAQVIVAFIGTVLFCLVVCGMIEESKDGE